MSKTSNLEKCVENFNSTTLSLQKEVTALLHGESFKSIIEEIKKQPKKDRNNVAQKLFSEKELEKRGIKLPQHFQLSPFIKSSDLGGMDLRAAAKPSGFFDIKITAAVSQGTGASVGVSIELHF
jgi:hypothetical protein